jgi:hypothetical protein
MSKTLKYTAFGLVLLVILLPGIQMGLHLIEEKPLNGAFIMAEKPVFSKGGWDSGEYQEQVEKYLKDHTGFRNFMVRLYNQVDYSIFRTANAEGATIGKNRQLYEYDYIRSWLGIDNPGESFISKKLNRAKFVQDYLKREKDIDLVIVFEPGKASFYPEYIPEKYKKLKNGPSTYELYVQKAKETGLDFIDWQQWFTEMKPESEFPLFPKYGTHWSVYGMKFATDSLISFIENRRGIDLGAFSADSMETSTTPRDTDDDVAKTMNLLIPPKGEILAYPEFSFDTAGHMDKPMVLAVADSYYWNIFNTRIPKNLFANEAFWYFNALVYPETYFQPIQTSDLDLKSEIEKQDIIFLMVTERFIHKFDWKFIDELYRLYTPEWLVDPVYENFSKIMSHDPWYNEMIDKAHTLGTSLEEELTKEAKYIIYENDTAYYMIRYGDIYYEDMISSIPDWMSAIREKARSRGITEEEMLELDAHYTFQREYPDYYEINQGISKALEEIRENPELMDSISKKANFYHFDKEEMTWIAAKMNYQENEIRRICQVIRNDNKWMEHISIKAKERGLTVEEMIRLDAEWTFEQKME